VLVDEYKVHINTVRRAKKIKERPNYNFIHSSSCRHPAVGDEAILTSGFVEKKK